MYKLLSLEVLVQSNTSNTVTSSPSNQNAVISLLVISEGNCMVLNVIWKIAHTSEFLKDSQVGI